ncbi:MAG: acetyl-CoA carboxylase biotin carboxyl carrier protein [Actinomycetes bacterium]
MQELGRELTALARTLSGPLHRLSVRSGDAEIAVEWDRAAAGGEGPAPAASASAEPEEDSGTAVAVRSPLVGTYYAAPAPDAAPFVTVGDEVEAGQTLAIVEAMKMMNSVVATEAGTVAEILVSNGQAVEFDQALILLLPPEVTP